MQPLQWKIYFLLSIENLIVGFAPCLLLSDIHSHPTAPLNSTPRSFSMVSMIWSNSHKRFGWGKTSVDIGETSTLTWQSWISYSSVMLRPKRMCCPRPRGNVQREAKKRGSREDFGHWESWSFVVLGSWVLDRTPSHTLNPKSLKPQTLNPKTPKPNLKP